MISSVEEAKLKIPPTLWQDPEYFDSTVSDAILAITKLPYEDALKKIIHTEMYKWNIKERCCCWFALSYAYPTLSDEMRLMMNGFFHLPSDVSFVLAASFGSARYFEKFYGEAFTSFPRFTRATHDLAEEKAVLNGHHHLLPRLAELVSQYKNRMPEKEAPPISPGDLGMFPTRANKKHLTTEVSAPSAGP